MIRRLRAWLLLLTVASGPLAAAELRPPPALPQSVDLATVLQLAREASPRLALERQAIAQAQAERITAGAYPNPVLSYGRTRPRGGDASEHDTVLELPLLIAGQRGARVERAEREIEAARARVAAGASTLAAEAAAAFVSLLAAQNASALLAAATDELARLRETIAGREAAGAASRYEVARVDMELGGVRAKLEESRAEVAERSGALAALLGLPDWNPRATGTLAALPLPTVRAQTARAQAQATPAALAAAREEAAARSGVTVAERERWPVPAVAAGRTEGRHPLNGGNFVGLSVEIPLLDTRRGLLARAQADAHAATLRRELVTAEIAANVQRLEAVILGRRAALERYEQETATRLPALRQMADDAYRLGRGSLLELIDATRTRYDMEQTRIGLAAALLEAQVRLLGLLGELDKAAAS